MRKAGRILAAILAVFIGAVLLIESPAFETRIINRICADLDGKLQGKVRIGSVKLNPFNAIRLGDVVLTDDDSAVEQSDTLLYFKNITATFSPFRLFRDGYIHLGRVRIDGGMVNVVTERKGPRGDNFSRVLQLPPNKSEDPVAGPDIFDIRRLEINGIRVTLRNTRPHKRQYRGIGINFYDMDLVADIRAENLNFRKGIMSGTVRECSAREKSGYMLYKVNGDARVGMGHTYIDELHISDPWSEVYLPHFNLSYRNATWFADFVNKVEMDAEVGRSHLGMQSVRYFSDNMRDNDMVMDIRQAMVEGPVRDLCIDNLQFRELVSGVSANFYGRIEGLPDKLNTKVDLHIRNSEFTTRRLPGKLGRFAKGVKFNLNADAAGMLDRLKVKALANSLIGAASAELDIDNAISGRPLSLDGKINTVDLDAGRILNQPELGPVSLEADASCVISDSPSAEIRRLSVSRLHLHDYDYEGIAAAGKISGDAFDGKLICSDPNLHFLFQGIFTLSKESRNALYKFYANVGYADLESTGIDRRGGKSKVSGEMYANFMRVSRGDLIGSIGIDRLQLETEKGLNDIGTITIDSHANESINRIKLSSSFVDAGFVGTKNLATMINDVKAVLLARTMPSLFSKGTAPQFSGASYNANLDFHDSRDILEFLAPGLYIADGSNFKMDLSEDGHLSAKAKSSLLAFGRRYVKELKMDLEERSDSLEMTLNATSLIGEKLTLTDSELSFLAAGDSATMNFTYKGTDAKGKNPGNLGATLKAGRDGLDNPILAFHSVPSTIYVEDEPWTLNDGHATISGKTLRDCNLTIRSNDQLLSLNGGFSATEKDTLSLNLENARLSILNAFLSNDYNFGGSVSGRSILISPTSNSLRLLTAIKCDSISVGGCKAGEVRLGSSYDESSGKLKVFLRNTLDGREVVNAQEMFDYGTSVGKLEAKVDRLDLGIAAPFLRKSFSSLNGYITGNIEAESLKSKFFLTSNELRLEDAGLEPAYTGVRYSINGPIRLEKNAIVFDTLSIRDAAEGKGTICGRLNHKNFGDMTIEANGRFHRMDLLAKGVSADEFYGNAKASGEISLSGPLSAMNVEATLNTDGGTIHIPIGGASRSKETNILSFKEKKHYEDPFLSHLNDTKVKRGPKGDLTARVNINATPEMGIQLEIDRESGNVISAYGDGRIGIAVRPSKGRFELSGDYNIHGGKYRFSALNSIAVKDFTINNGSSLSFRGKPMDTVLDVDALYSLKTTLSNLISDTTSVSTRKNVECGIHISDKLSDPKVSFSINVPDLDPTTKSLVESALNTEDKVQKQFIALLVTGAFVPSEQGGVFNTSNVLYSNLSNIMSNQLNNILQKLEIPVDLGLNYLRNEVGTNIFSVAVSTQLFNNRVVVGGSIGNRQSSSSASSDVVGDLDVEIKLNRRGTFRLNLFSHSADVYTRYLDRTQRNGIGVMFQQEFDKIADFFSNIFISKEKREQKELERLERSRNMKKEELQ